MHFATVTALVTQTTSHADMFSVQVDVNARREKSDAEGGPVRVPDQVVRARHHAHVSLGQPPLHGIGLGAPRALTSPLS